MRHPPLHFKRPSITVHQAAVVTHCIAWEENLALRIRLRPFLTAINAEEILAQKDVFRFIQIPLLHYNRNNIGRQGKVRILGEKKEQYPRKKGSVKIHIPWHPSPSSGKRLLAQFASSRH